MCINHHLCDPYESVQESQASLCTTLSYQLFHSFSCYSHIVFLIIVCLISLILLVFAYCVFINLVSLWSSNTMIFICYTMASKNLHIQSIAYLNRIAYAAQHCTSRMTFKENRSGQKYSISKPSQSVRAGVIQSQAIIRTKGYTSEIHV